MLKGIDALVFDVQTPAAVLHLHATMAYCMEEAAKRNIAFFVLDLPIRSAVKSSRGPMLDPDKTNFRRIFSLCP